MSAPLLLMYNLDNDKGTRRRLLCMKLHIRFRSVTPSEYGQPVGALAGFCPSEPDAPAPAFDDEMLVMVNFDGGLLNRFLQQIRAAHIPPVALKAMLTPTNLTWSSARLHDEIRSEHEAMQQNRRAHDDSSPKN